MRETGGQTQGALPLRESRCSPQERRARPAISQDHGWPYRQDAAKVRSCT